MMKKFSSTVTYNTQQQPAPAQQQAIYCAHGCGALAKQVVSKAGKRPGTLYWTCCDNCDSDGIFQGYVENGPPTSRKAQGVKRAREPDNALEQRVAALEEAMREVIRRLEAQTEGEAPSE